MTVIGRAEVEVGPKTDGFASELKSKIGDALKNPVVIAGAAVAAVGATVTAFSKSAVDKFQEVGGEVKKLVTVTGGSAEAMSRLRFAAEETGVSTDSLGIGIKKLSQNIVNNHDDLDKLGIKYKDARGQILPMDKTLANVAEKFKNMPNGVEKNALVIKLFGRSGTELIPILNKGKDGLAQLGAEADKFGLTLTQKNLDAIKRNTMAHRELQAAMDGLKVQVGARLLPVMADLAEFTNSKAIPVITALTGLVATKLSPVLDALSKDVRLAYDAFLGGFANADATIGPGVNTLSKVFLELGAGVKHSFEDAKAAYAAFVVGFTTRGGVTDQLDSMTTAFAAVGVAVRDSLAVLRDLAGFLADHPTAVKRATEAVLGFVAAYKLVKFGKNTIDFVTTGVDKVTSAIESIASGISKITGDKVVNIVSQQAGQGAAAGAAKGGGNAVGEQAGNVVSGAAGGALGNIFDLKAVGPRITLFARGLIAALASAIETAAIGLLYVGEAIAAIVFSPEFLIAAAVTAVSVLAFHFRKGLVDLFANKIPGFVSDAVKAVPGFGSALLDIGKSLLGGLLDGVVIGFTAVGQFFIDLPNNIAYAIGYVGGTLFKIGSLLIIGLFQGVKFIYEEVSAFFIALPGAVSGFVGDVTHTLYEQGRGLVMGLFTGAKEIYLDVTGFFQRVQSDVVGFVGDVGRTLFDKGRGLIVGLKDGILDFWHDPVGFFRDLPGNVRGFVGDVGRILFDKGRDIIVGFKDGVVSLYDSAVAFFRDLRSKVIGAVQGAKDWLIEAGKDVIRGLITGIDAIKDQVVNKMKSLGGSVIDGFKKGAGIGSPSRFMHESGIFLMKGLANGIDASKQLALDAINDVANSVLDPFSNPAMAGVPSGLGRRGTAGGRMTHIENLTIMNSKTLKENLDEVDRLAIPL